MTFYAFNGVNYADFIFTGCNTYQSCGGPYNPCFADGNPFEPVTSIAAPGTPAMDIPESTLIASGGAQPASSVPEPGNISLCL
jgi:hypothetical protein